MQEKSNYRTMIGLIIVWGRKKNDERHVNHHQLSNYQTTILMLPLTRRRTIRGAMTTTRRPRSSFHLLRVIIVDSQFKRSSSVQFSYQWEVSKVFRFFLGVEILIEKTNQYPPSRPCHPLSQNQLLRKSTMSKKVKSQNNF